MDKIGQSGSPPSTRAMVNTVSRSSKPNNDYSIDLSSFNSENSRRHLTVLFCDMVGSSEIAARLDPEDWFELIKSYRNACANKIEDYSGFVARYFGDGILAYFGYPHAYENAAENAIKSAIDIVKMMINHNASYTWPDNLQLSVRIALDTGTMIFGEPSRDSNVDKALADGIPAYRASRLQNLAKPNSILITENTQNIVGNLFEYYDIGMLTLKGFPESTHAYQVLRTNRIAHRFNARPTPYASPLVGREQEKSLLLERWYAAQNGQGQTVTIAGEAGIGKSRLTLSLLEDIKRDNGKTLLFQCSSYYRNSALYPVITQIEKAGNFLQTHSASRRLKALRRLFKKFLGSENLDETSLISDFLSTSAKHDHSSSPIYSEQRKKKLFEILIRIAQWLAKDFPLAIIAEDTHWIDPSSQELLSLLINKIQKSRILVITTSRSSTLTAHNQQPNFLFLKLSPLDYSESSQLIQYIFEENPIPGAIIEHIISKADGIPLFIEELTNTVSDTLPLDNFSLEHSSDDFNPDHIISHLAVPDTLQGLLMEKVDRLEPITKKLAQICSVLGRDIPFDILSALIDCHEDELNKHMQFLVSSGLMQNIHAIPKNTYTFKHALIRDAAYNSLLRNQKTHLHSQVVQVLELLFKEYCESMPELLAYHCLKAGLYEKGISYSLSAGQNAYQKYANKEAIAHLEHGLAVLKKVSNPEHSQLEFTFRKLLSSALITQKGWASSSVERNYKQVLELCRSHFDAQKQFYALKGLFDVYLLRGDLKNCQHIDKQLFFIAAEEKDPFYKESYHRSAGIGLLYKGHFPHARYHLNKSYSLLKKNPQYARISTYGTDPEIITLSISAWIDCFLGLFQDSVFKHRQAIIITETADEENPFTKAYAHGLAASFFIEKQEYQIALNHANLTIDLADTYGFRYWSAYGRILRLVAASLCYEKDDCIRYLDASIAKYKKVSTLLLPYFLTLKADVCCKLGFINAGLNALDAIKHSDIGFYSAETLRIRGELLAKRKVSGTTFYHFFEKSLTVARSQKARLFELRAATSLVHHSIGMPNQAYAIRTLALVADHFSDHQDDYNVRDAKLLLKSLQNSS